MLVTADRITSSIQSVQDPILALVGRVANSAGEKTST